MSKMSMDQVQTQKTPPPTTEKQENQNQISSPTHMQRIQVISFGYWKFKRNENPKWR